MDNRCATGWGECPEPDLKVPYFMTKEYQEAEKAAKAAKRASHLKKIARRREKRLWNALVILWLLLLAGMVITLIRF